MARASIFQDHIDVNVHQTFMEFIVPLIMMIVHPHRTKLYVVTGYVLICREKKNTSPNIVVYVIKDGQLKRHQPIHLVQRILMNVKQELIIVQLILRWNVLIVREVLNVSL